MKTGIILAGGKSTRMGEDKALVNSNVKRLSAELKKAGCCRIVIMCGSEERVHLFEGECVLDSADNLAESILDVAARIDGPIQLAPCDAYLADADFFNTIDGVPVDDTGQRQPLLANIESSSILESSKKISDVFANVPTCEGGIKARNTNTLEQLKEIQSLLLQDDQ